MVHSLLPVPFADAARQQLFEAVLAALLAEADAPATVLLGNLRGFTAIEADALLIRPTGAALVVLLPRHGHLTMPALAYGTWQLDGQALPDRNGPDNPFEQYRQQRPAALAWLSAQLDYEFIDCQGIALFSGPLTFGPEVESHLHQFAGAPDFQLVGGPALLPARLRTLPPTATTELPAAALLAWADQLTAELAAENEITSYSSNNYLEQKLRQLWRWLGAEDIPADPPYGGIPSAPINQQERARLQQLRHELQAELHQQRQEATAREGARTQELALLRQQVVQAGLSATERRAEQQATTKLEVELRTARAELAARNQELDTRIQQLGLIINQLRTTNEPAQSQLSTQAAAARRPVAPAVARPRATSFRRLRQAERWGVAALVLAGLGVGTWGVVRLAHPPKPRPATADVSRRSPIFRAEEAATPNVVYVVDSTLAPTQVATDDASLYSADNEPVDATELAAPPYSPANPLTDSAATPATVAPAPTAAPDSAATPSPGP